MAADSDSSLLRPVLLHKHNNSADDSLHSHLLADDDATDRPDILPYFDDAYSSSRGALTGKLVNGIAGLSPPKSAFVSNSRSHRTITSPAPKMMVSVPIDSVHESTSAPSSPPGLTYSKSSKSSSSINSDDDLSDAGLAEKSGNFEEVVLEDGDSRDMAEDCNLPPASRPTLRRPMPKSLPPGEFPIRQRRRSGTSPQLRPLPNGLRPKYPSLYAPVHGVLSDQSLNLPNGRQRTMRAASSPTSPFTRQYPQRIPSRSPSPSKHWSPNGYPRSPQMPSGATPKTSLEVLSENGGLQRRTSWQPGRKSVKELEAECNDEDDEVPDEAILENVPVSPMPGHYSHYSQFKNHSTTSLRSTTPSPHRIPSYANLHSANIPKQAKRPSAPPHHNSQYGSPRSPKHSRPMLPHSATVSSFPPDAFNRKHRSKSWTEDLNQEARQLSHALEQYAERSTEKTPSVTNTPSSSPPRSIQTKPRAMSSVTELPAIPPLQKGNIMIDPLPISKEKEAVLSRTRPSWLPPKSQKEEKKHMKEFQQMMARAAEAEKKRALKQQETRETREEMQGSIARIWDQHVIPNWDAVIKEPRTRELWWRGVTPRSRGEVWQKAVGNELELSQASFDAALARANALEEELAEMPDEDHSKSKEAAWLAAIARDVPNTFPELQMYHPTGRLHQSLTDVLKAYTMYRSDVGYVYGTHLVAGIICLLLPAPAAFVLLANMLNRPLPLAFHIHDQAQMAHAHALVLATLKYKSPTLHAHLTSAALGLQPADFLDPIFRCLFAYNLPHHLVARIWDVWVFEGDKALVRAAVAVLGMLESRLYGDRDDVLAVVGWRNEARWDVGDDEERLVEAFREAGKVDSPSSTTAAAAGTAVALPTVVVV